MPNERQSELDSQLNQSESGRPRHNSVIRLCHRRRAPWHSRRQHRWCSWLLGRRSGEATIAFAVGFCAVARSALGESPTALDDRYCLTDNAAKASVCGLFGNRHVIRAGGLSEVFPSRPVKEIAYMPSAYLSRDGSGGLRPGHWAAGLAAGIVRE